MRRLTTALVLTLFLSTLASAGEPASLNTAGTVWTNKVLLPSGTTLHQGDRVETDRASAAVIASRSTGRVEVRERSSVSLGEGQVTLHQGVVATAKAAVQFGDVSVKPQAADNALVVVANRDGQILIAAHRGNALISQPGVAPLLLPAGSYAVPAAPGAGPDRAQNDPKDDDDDDDGGAAVPTGGAAQSGGWTIGSLSHGSSVAVVAGIGAAAIGGAVAGFALTEDSPSPSTQ